MFEYYGYGSDFPRPMDFSAAGDMRYEAEQGVDGSNLEGNFVTYENSTFASSGRWSVEGTFDTTSTQEHYNVLYGYDPVYSGELDCDANGAAMKVTVDQELYDAVKAKTASWPVAKFSFRGSGFSFMSRCALDTGIFILDVVPPDKDLQPVRTQKAQRLGRFDFICLSRLFLPGVL